MQSTVFKITNINFNFLFSSKQICKCYQDMNKDEILWVFYKEKLPEEKNTKETV